MVDGGEASYSNRELIEAIGLDSNGFSEITQIEGFFSEKIDPKRRKDAEKILKFQKYCEIKTSKPDEELPESIESLKKEINRILESNNSNPNFLYDKEYLRELKVRYKELEISKAVQRTENEQNIELEGEENITQKEEELISYILGEKYQP